MIWIPLEMPNIKELSKGIADIQKRMVTCLNCVLNSFVRVHNLCITVVRQTSTGRSWKEVFLHKVSATRETDKRALCGRGPDDQANIAFCILI